MSNIVVPAVGESVVEATVARWVKNEGEPVTVGEPVVHLETDKVDLEVGAPQNGVLARIAQPQGSNVKVGDVLGVVEAAGQAQQPPKRAEQAPDRAEPARPLQDPPRPLQDPPAARRAAREHGVDVGEVTATGVEQPSEPKALSPEPKAPSPEPKPPIPEAALEERVRMSRRRQTIARRLVEAQHTAAMLTTFNDVDMSAVMELRASSKDAFKQRHGVGLGIVSFFVKASIAALRAFPRLNAEVQGDEMVLKHYYDIGVAVGASEGLVVPVLRDADRMSFGAMEKSIKDFAKKAEGGTLTLDDLRGGTFTITNGGVFGSLMSTPILNPPQVGILGLHKIADRPVAIDGQVVIRPMMYVALSYDHRIVDGLEAVQFLAKVKMLVEDPARLLFEG